MTTEARFSCVFLVGVACLTACGSAETDKDNWVRMESPTTSDYVDLSVVDGAVWVLQADGTVFSWNGSSWINDDLPCSESGGLNRASNPPRALWASAANDAWVVGGDICHFDGTEWQPMRNVFSGVNDVFTQCAPFQDVFGQSANQVWVLSENCVLELDTDGPRINGQDVYFKATVGSSSVVNLCTNSCTWAYDTSCDDGGSGSRTTACALGTDCSDCGTRQSEDPNKPKPTRLWVSGTQDIWGIGDKAVLRYQAGTWVEQTNVNVEGARSIWGLASDDIYVAASTGVYHFDGTGWSRNAADNLQVSALWGTAKEDIWAVGKDAFLDTTEIQHWNGSEWTYAVSKRDLATSAFIGVLGTQLLKGASGNSCCGLLAVDGNSADNVWAVGRGGTVLRYQAPVFPPRMP
ncbi:MAG: hypothetical protein AB2A00_21655 [Myxococcota bacterium]